MIILFALAAFSFPAVIHAFAAHRVASNLLMLLMICSGLFVFNRMEVRFFPQFEIQVVSVSVVWRGASAEDVADAILTPLETELRNVNDVKQIAATARDGSGNVRLEFPDRTDINQAVQDIRRRVNRAQSKLPADSETPSVVVAESSDEVMRLSLTGGLLEQLRPLARRIENELRALGVARVEVKGLPEDEIQIRLSQRQLTALGLSLREVGEQVAAQNIDVTAGQVGGGGNNRLLRALSERQDMNALEDLRIVDRGGNIVRLGEVATLRRQAEEDQELIYFNGAPAVEFRIIGLSGKSVLNIAEETQAWLEKRRQTLPPGVAITSHRERWQAIQSRLNLLIVNGLQGLVLVLFFLLLFLHYRLAFWVAAGIPATFMVAVAILHWSGGSINMISMFAFIMVTGIVVDDAIVVGENAMYRWQRGEPPLAAAVAGAKEMWVSVFSSTLTTIASFIPLLVVGGIVGAIMFVIPVVVICVLVASLFECFAVLPGHIRGAFAGMTRRQSENALSRAFVRFQDGAFRRSVELALRYRWVTLTAAVVMLVASVSLLYGGFLKYRFFPGAELNRVQAQVAFVAGTPRATVQDYMNRVAESVRRTEAAFPEETNLVRYISLYIGNAGGRRQDPGDEKASMVVELAQPDERRIGTRDFVRVWRRNLPQQAGLESIQIRESRGGPAGEDLEIRLFGEDAHDLKAASESLQAALPEIAGVSRPDDDFPYGKAQIIFDVNALGQSLNLSSGAIAGQLRDAFNGYPAQTFHNQGEEVEVRVMMEDEGGGGELAGFRARLPGGDDIALEDVVDLRGRRGFDVIQRDNARAMVNVVANIDFDATDVARVQTQLRRDVLPPIVNQYGVDYTFEGSSADERETTGDMKVGLVIALAAIFVILAAVFVSWTLPLVIVCLIPFGLNGAIWGHWLMGHDISILSAFGIFALNGIIVNDAIILIRDYLGRIKNEPQTDPRRLIVDSVCRRLRAVLLTSLTTIGGLTPLMFETSTQAQFLIPMAISLCFGLGLGTLLLLYLLPVFLSIHHSVAEFFRRVSAALFVPSGGLNQQ